MTFYGFLRQFYAFINARKGSENEFYFGLEIQEYDKAKHC